MYKRINIYKCFKLNNLTLKSDSTKLPTNRCLSYIVQHIGADVGVLGGGGRPPQVGGHGESGGSTVWGGGILQTIEKESINCKPYNSRSIANLRKVDQLQRGLCN